MFCTKLNVNLIKHICDTNVVLTIYQMAVILKRLIIVMKLQRNTNTFHFKIAF